MKKTAPKPTAKKSSKRSSALGPVENLESYVKAEWWRDIFNANYLRTDADVVDDPNITSYEVNQFESYLGVDKTAPILDLCCGHGRHILEFARRGYSQTYGFDRSRYLISRAKRQAKEEGLRLQLREGDARRLPYAADTFAGVYLAGNSFGYFEAAHDDEQVLSQVYRVLQPKGVILLDIANGEYLREHFEPRSWEWLDTNYFVCRERELAADRQRLVTREVITHIRKGVIADQFYAERLYDFASIEALLKKMGFGNITFHQTLEVQSQRNQDLGMMAQRLIVTAVSTKIKPSRKQQQQPIRKVTVLMGDPTMQDAVKPSQTFDEDDFDTVDRLKDALKQLPNYEFSFFNKHKNMISWLQQNQKEIHFAFNLCDEGFENFATKELHVPAVLEMLHIPYTGGTPQCLAVCYDKSLVRGLAKEIDIPVPEAFTIRGDDTNFFELPIHFPVIVKPNMGDSSLGITKDSVCHSIGELEAAISRLRKQFGSTTAILVEEFLTGKDLTIGLIGNINQAYTIFPIIEEDYSALPPDLPKICGYEAKWDPDSPYSKLKSIVADLPEETVRFIETSSVRLFERLQCRDYARFDWRLDHRGTPRLLEANPNPGWCWDGHLAKMAALVGYDYVEMLDLILRAATQRLFPEQLP